MIIFEIKRRKNVDPMLKLIKRNNKEGKTHNGFQNKIEYLNSKNLEF